MKMTKIAIAISAALLANSAFATNGMNMEGYGPVSTAMGGTAQAFNNGLGGMMNNPATMGMGSIEGNRFQIGVGMLNPDITSTHTSGVTTDSTGSFLMPFIGYATKKDGFTWGIGIIPEGGMGTDYGRAGAGDLFAGGMSMNNNQTALSGKTIKTEVGIGRIVVPLVFDINDQLTIGGSIDYVWGGMDLQMDMDGASFGQLMNGNGGSVGGSMADRLQTAMAAGQITDVNWARFDFDDNSDFTQEASGAGFAGKLGMTFKINNQWAIGASYHSQTKMSDFTGDATLTMNVAGPQPGSMPVTGKIAVKDFQWPQKFGLGTTWTPNERWKLSADLKHVKWSETMDKLTMSFNADSNVNNGNFANTTLDVTMDQNWLDRTTIMLGGQFMYSETLALRFGYNYAASPVPNANLNPLFPATTTRHYTLGFGWQPAPQHSIDASVVFALKHDKTNPNTGITVNHGQTNWQLMYSYAWGIIPK